MRLICDFHIHSKYSRATSQKMDLDNLAAWSKIKGLDLLGTGDFTHPTWFSELKKKLKPLEGNLYEYKNIFWILTCEVSTVYEQDKKIRKVHHVIHVPSFEEAEQLNEILSKYGNLTLDGRPVLNLPSPELVEAVMDISKENFIYPAHAWTSWFGVLGEFSGFNSLHECYQDRLKNIHALETGMSSDPAMNWRLSQLDRITPISSSDSHSPWPWRLGREANVFELDEIDYGKIHDAIKNKDTNKFKYTIETKPDYGKYHFTGHRNCGISLSPEAALRLNNICPRCGRKLTIGVAQRLEKLADRPAGYVPKKVIPFKTLLPLAEIIAGVLGVGLYSRRVQNMQTKFLHLGNELDVLLRVPEHSLTGVYEKVAKAIILCREGKVRYEAGFDGQYGKPMFDLEEGKEKTIQRSVGEFT